MIQPKNFYTSLVQHQMDFFAGVPDSLLQPFCAHLQHYAPPNRHIITANEGNAVALASGYHISTGKYGVVYLQNSGIGNIVNPLLSLADAAIYHIPMLFIVGYRGQPGVPDEPQHLTQGKLTIPLLETMGIKWMMLQDEYLSQVTECAHYLTKENKPIALVVSKGQFEPISPPTTPNIPVHAGVLQLKREQALETVLEKLELDSVLVSTTGKTSREIFEIRERRHESHDRDFLTVGAMGHTASIALGMSLGSSKSIYCIDGDGSFLMHMGGLAVAMQIAGDNFHYILINNGSHESVGGQPTIAFHLKMTQLLQSLGCSTVWIARTQQEVFLAMEQLPHTPKSALVIEVAQGSRDDLGRPTISPKQNKQDMMKMFSINL